MKVKISGSSGFLGKNLIAFLDSKSFEVESLILRSPNWSSKIEKGTNAIIHLAGKAHDLKNEANSKEYFQINTELTKKLYKVFLHSNASIFIYISSVKAIADKVHGDILFESDNPQPLTAYGKSKLAAENYLQKLTPPEGKQIYILRPCMIHGPHNKGNLNLLYKVVK